MLLNDDVVADGQAKARTLPRGLSREERVEHLVFHVGRNASAVIADPDFHPVAKVFGRGSKRRLVIAAVRFIPALSCCIEAI